ncbi:hypothetical protein FM106_18950 [Brachybacterium faecium]|nr:hypothetical protein FM106_18950 [Brachybacterium faecium]
MIVLPLFSYTNNQTIVIGCKSATVLVPVFIIREISRY